MENRVYGLTSVKRTDIRELSNRKIKMNTDYAFDSIMRCTRDKDVNWEWWH
jgi:hypothetical protein